MFFIAAESKPTALHNLKLRPHNRRNAACPSEGAGDVDSRAEIFRLLLQAGQIVDVNSLRTAFGASPLNHDSPNLSDMLHQTSQTKCRRFRFLPVSVTPVARVDGGQCSAPQGLKTARHLHAEQLHNIKQTRQPKLWSFDTGQHVTHTGVNKHLINVQTMTQNAGISPRIWILFKSTTRTRAVA